MNYPENKIPDVSGLATKNKLTTLENKAPDITNLATKTALSTLEKKNLMLVVLLKKQIITLEFAEIDTKVSNLVGKIAKNKDLLDEKG